MLNESQASLLSQPSESKSNSFVAASQPSIFDIVAQERMHSLLADTFSHVATWLSSSLSVNNTSASNSNISYIASRFGSLLATYKHECYVLIHSLVEYMFLTAHQALSTEHFYAMRRQGNCPHSSLHPPALLTQAQRLSSIVAAICFPYLKLKLDSAYSEMERVTSRLELEQAYARARHWLEKIKCMLRLFVFNFHPYMHLAYTCLFVAYKLRYLLGMSEFSSPLLHAIGLKLLRRTATSPTLEPNTFGQRALSWMGACVTAGLFVVEYWRWHEQQSLAESYATSDGNFNSDGNIVSAFKSMRRLLKNTGGDNHEDEDEDERVASRRLVPPPPTPPSLLDKTGRRQQPGGDPTCPLCMKKRRNECALSVSGLVFCYPCIFRFVKENARCPLTSFPCTTKHIIRIYSE